jgi:hypothetical protein
MNGRESVAPFKLLRVDTLKNRSRCTFYRVMMAFSYQMSLIEFYNFGFGPVSIGRKFRPQIGENGRGTVAPPRSRALCRHFTDPPFTPIDLKSKAVRYSFKRAIDWYLIELNLIVINRVMNF